MKWPKMPKVKFRRVDLERVLITCSAALVVLLSFRSGNVDPEPYEERLEEIPQAQAAAAAIDPRDMQQTVVYYEDGDGYLVPVQRDVMRQDGIAKATLEMMVQSAKNDMDAARLGLMPVVPAGTTIDLDIAQGHARVDLGRNALAAVDKEQEENMRTAIVWALTEFDTVKDVNFLVDGQKRDTLTHGTNISGSYTRVGLNREADEETEAVFADAAEVQMYFPAQDSRLLVPVSRTVYQQDDVATAVFEFLRGPKADSGLETPLDSDVQLLGVSVITVILPAWYQAMTPEERKKPLNRLKLTVLVHASSLLLGFGFKDIQVAYIGPGYEKYEGKTVHQIAREEGLSDLNAYLMLCEQSDFKGRVNMGPYTTREIISDFEHNENCLYMTDAWVEEHGVQNPAIYDCFPKFLQDSLLGTGDTLENTIRRMTGATADRFQLADRGYIRPGCYADLTVFDEAEIKAAHPDQEKSFGIRQVFINGKQVLSEGTLDKEALKTTGRAIRIG